MIADVLKQRKTFAAALRKFTAAEWVMVFYEFFLSAWPFLMGAVTLRAFEKRCWLPFSFDLAVCGILMASTWLLHAAQRKTIKVQQLALDELLSGINQIGGFFDHLLTRNSGTVHLDVKQEEGVKNFVCEFQRIQPKINLKKMD